jgi:hypothetical protein
MEAKLLEQILQELRDIRADLSWFKEREEAALRGVEQMIGDGAKQLLNDSLTTEERTKALAVEETKTK